MDPIDLVLSHRYSEAAAQYEARLKKHPRDMGYLDGHAVALLCLRQRLEQALKELRQVNTAGREEMASMGGKSQPNLDEIGTVLWLLKRRDEAVRTFKGGAEGIRDGSIEFGDLGGGASHGLLLWYAGVTIGDNKATDFALEYLRELARERAYGKYGTYFWPQPLPLFVTGQMSREQVLMELVGTSNADEAIRRARQQSSQNKAIWGDLAQGLFYLAARRRAEGREAECHAEMIRCASMENPITAVEWFLARAEAGYVPGSPDWPWAAAEKVSRKRR